MNRTSSKINTREGLIKLLEARPSKGGKIGFTSGVFDLLHAGHVEYLEQAKTKCDLLIVGVNSDQSVRGSKGPKRPIQPADERARIVSALESVDFVFIFEESNNNKNIELIRPEFYIKAGDYKESELSSAPLVERYGGKVVLIPVVHASSSSRIIDKILNVYAADITSSIEISPPERKPAVFVDRDGTINQHVEYLHEPQKFQLIPRALEGLKKLKDAGYRVVIVTNQPGIGIGYFTKEDFFAVNRIFLRKCSEIALAVDRVYFCPHGEADNCLCRKPKTALIDRAVKELNIDLKESFVIGDTTIDLKLGKNAGCKTILVKTGLAGSDNTFDVTPDSTVQDLWEGATAVLNLKSGGMVK